MNSKTTLTIERLSFGTIYKVILLGMVFSFVPFAVFMGVLALFGAGTVTWNGQPLTGVSGLIASPFIGLFISIFFTIVIGSMIAIGLWLYSKATSIDITIFGARGLADD